MADRTGSSGILGPTDSGEWLGWRKARDKRIANPPRTKTCKDLTQGPPVPPVQREGKPWLPTYPEPEPNDE